MMMTSLMTSQQHFQNGVLLQWIISIVKSFDFDGCLSKYIISKSSSLSSSAAAAASSSFASSFALQFWQVRNLWLPFHYLPKFYFWQVCWSVCLFVCLSVCLFVCTDVTQYLKNEWTDHHQTWYKDASRSQVDTYCLSRS